MSSYEQPLDDDEAPLHADEQIARLLEQQERYGRFAAAYKTPSDPEELINGSVRDRRGRFAMPNDRTFLADSRQTLPEKRMKRAARKFEISLNQIKRSRRLVDTVRGVRQLRARLDELEHEVIAYARSRGWSWRSVAECLQISHQAVHRRHARTDPRRRRRGMTRGVSATGRPKRTAAPTCRRRPS